MNRALSSRHWLLALPLAAGLLLAAEHANAQDSAAKIADPTGAADAEFNAGTQAQEQKNWEEAYTHLNKAWNIKKTTYIAVNLGIVERRLERWLPAAEHLTYALQAETAPQLRGRLEKQLEECKARIGTTKITTTPPGATLILDGREVGKTPLSLPLFVSPGPHTLIARLDKQEARREFIATAGTETSLVVPLPGTTAPGAGPSVPPGAALTSPQAATPTTGAAPDYVPPPDSTTQPAPEYPGSNGVRTGVLITEGILAVGGLAAGVGFRLRGSSLDSEARKISDKMSGTSACSSNPSAPNCVALRDKLKSTDHSNNLSTGFFIGGGALAIATVVTLIAWKPRRPARTGQLQFVPVAGVGQLGFNVTGQF